VIFVFVFWLAVSFFALLVKPPASVRHPVGYHAVPVLLVSGYGLGMHVHRRRQFALRKPFGLAPFF